MAYLIPKSARNVKLELFKGMGLIECAIVAVAIIVSYLILQFVDLRFYIKIIIVGPILLVGIVLALPSPIEPMQKTYQSVRTIYEYLASEKRYKKKVKKDGKK